MAAAANVTQEITNVTNHDVTTNSENHVSKRQDYINWDDYFMALSILSAMRSKGMLNLLSINFFLTI